MVNPFPRPLAFSNLFICALVKNIVWSPSKSLAPIFILVAAQLAFIDCRNFCIWLSVKLTFALIYCVILNINYNVLNYLASLI